MSKVDERSRAADKISLVNHASVFIESGNIGLLSDPWYRGTAFNDGWSLIFENSADDIRALLERVTHLFISHEHPDHFSIEFFNAYAETLKLRNIVILFQETKDQRIQKFLTGKYGLTVRELPVDRWCSIDGGFRVRLYRCGSFDSALVVETDDFVYINLNDCDFDDADIRRINGALPTKRRITLNQFSYAAWRGSLDWMRKAAAYKLERIRKDSMAFKPDAVLPFASFVYFSHEENKRLNEGINRPDDVAAYGRANSIPMMFLPPWPGIEETSTLVGHPDARETINQSGLAFWRWRYEAANFRFSTGGAKPVADISPADEQKYVSRIKRHNNLAVMSMVRLLTFKKIFGDIRIRLADSHESYLINFRQIRRLGPVPQAAGSDIVMSKDSLALLLRTEYGLDTLSVNGRFSELSAGAFNRLVFALGFMTLNSSGFGINFRSLFDWQIVKRIVSLPFRVLLKNS